MKNFSKILCVVLALIVALSAASCSLGKQYAYNKDDVELPVGVYICNLYIAYNQAMNYAQQSDKYDSETGKYDGKKSFLDMEITDDDGETAVASKWIVDTAKKETKHAVAVSKKFKELGCTMDEAAVDQAKSLYKSQWEQNQETLEPYGISYDSFFQLVYTLPTMETEVFKAEYAADGPSKVSDEELTTYFKDNYTAFKYFSVNLYTTSDTESSDGTSETESVNTPLSDDEIAKLQKDFKGYATTLSKGGSFDKVVSKYMDAYNVEEDPTQSGVEVIEDDTDDEIRKAIKSLKDGQAMTLEVGDDATTKQLYIIYREPIENQVKDYTDRDGNGLTVLQKMKEDDFKKLIDKYAKDISLSSDCESYEPSMFEEEKE